MRPSGLVCPRCKQPLVSQEGYCQQCHYYPEPGTSTAFPPYSSSTDLSGQHWTQPGMAQGPSGEKLQPSGPYSPHPKGPNKFLLIGGFFLVCLLLVGVGSFWMGRSSSTAGGQVPSTPSVSNAPTNPPALTPTPRTINEGISIPCVNPPIFVGNTPGCGGLVSLMFEKIVIDPSQGDMAFQFKITNGGQTAGTFAFANLTLQDDTGKTYQGGTQAIGQWDLGSGNSTIKVPTFPLLPKYGTHYTLSIALWQGGMGDYTFQDQSLTF